MPPVPENRPASPPAPRRRARDKLQWWGAVAGALALGFVLQQFNPKPAGTRGDPGARQEQRKLVEARTAKAQEYIAAGDFARALEEYVWCYDEGMPRFANGTAMANTALLRSIASLGERYPPALAALRERRQRALDRLRAHPAGRRRSHEFVAISKALGDTAGIIALYDELPPEDPERRILARAVYPELVQARRYQDALQGRHAGELAACLEPDDAVDSREGPARRAARSLLIFRAGQNLEVLAGGGEAELARALANQLLEFDATPETRALVQKHLLRAGRPELVPER